MTATKSIGKLIKSTFVVNPAFNSTSALQGQTTARLHLPGAGQALFILL
ncbi:MAG TPA: hypothetical protein VH307_22945 [Streptosporangiaceae bacterium]|jgi:hypothetical protein|nr:hypothetical protein [Streptosporangiaceae bacterium]